MLLSKQGTAFVVYEDIYEAKNACDHLSGFNVCNRYLIVLYYQVSAKPRPPMRFPCRSYHSRAPTRNALVLCCIHVTRN